MRPCAVLDSGARGQFLARRIVLAIPFSTLRLVRIDTPFSPEKMAAIRGLPYHEATTVPVPDAHPLLQAKPLRSGAHEWSGGHLDTSFGLPGTRGILANTTGNPEIEGASKPCRRCKRALSHRPDKAAISTTRARAEKTYIQRWVDEPAHGVRSRFSGRPDDRLGFGHRTARVAVLFAGEHTSPWTGWMEGALWSGERAAQEIWNNSGRIRGFLRHSCIGFSRRFRYI